MHWTAATPCRNTPLSRLGVVVALGFACESPPPREARPAVVEPAAVGARATDEALPSGEPAVVPARTEAGRSLEGLTPAERQRYRAAVGEGRRLHAARDYQGAIAAYGRALDIAPGTARTLSEQGWAALFADRLELAESVLQQAEAAVEDDDRLLASILYNQGRVAQAQERIEVAIAVYQRSLALRPHPDAYRHLHGLAGGTRYVFGPAMRRLQGPYPSLAQLCAQERRLTRSERSAEQEEGFACIPDAARGVAGKAVDVPPLDGVLAPWTELRFVETRPSSFATRFHAALRTEDGWFVAPDIAVLGRGTPDVRERATQLSMRVADLQPGGAAEVVIEIETSWSRREGKAEIEAETHRVELLCGQGPSGVPSCTGAIPRATSAMRREDGRPVQTRWSVQRHMQPDGTLRLDGDAGELGTATAALLGEHALVFP